MGSEVFDKARKMIYPKIPTKRLAITCTAVLRVQKHLPWQRVSSNFRLPIRQALLPVQQPFTDLCRKHLPLKSYPGSLSAPVLDPIGCPFLYSDLVRL